MRKKSRADSQILHNEYVHYSVASPYYNIHAEMFNPTDQIMAASLEPGSVAYLRYGNRVVTLMVLTLTTGLSTATLSYFSKMAAVADWQGIRHTLRTYVRMALIVTVPLTLLLVYFSEPITRLLFERGAFTAADTQQVGLVQAFLLIQLPFYVLSLLYSRLIMALKGNHVLMWGAAISLGSKIVLNYILMQRLGVAGIALSTAIVYFVALSFSFVMLPYLVKRAKSGSHKPITMNEPEL